MIFSFQNRTNNWIFLISILFFSSAFSFSVKGPNHIHHPLHALLVSPKTAFSSPYVILCYNSPNLNHSNTNCVSLWKHVQAHTKRAYQYFDSLNFVLYTMGTRRDTQTNALFGWVKKLSIKVKIFLGTLLALCALLALRYTVKDRDYFFIASEAVHLTGIIVLIYKLFTKKTCSGTFLFTQLRVLIFYF